MISFVLSGAQICYETHCKAIDICRDPERDLQCTWKVTDLSDNTAKFDSVVVTIPIPQLFKLAGSVQDFLERKKPLLGKVQYSSRYAMALYFSLHDKIDVPWTAKYVTADPCVRFMSVDSRKRFGTGTVVYFTEIPKILVVQKKSSQAKNRQITKRCFSSVYISQRILLLILPRPIDNGN